MTTCSADIAALLSGTSAITSLIDTYNDSNTTEFPAIFPYYEIPVEYEVEKVINYYRTDLYSGGSIIIDETYSIDCRARTEDESQAIAEAVFDTFNRYCTSSVSFVCDILQVIPPINSADLYNTPVQVRAIKGA